MASLSQEDCRALISAVETIHGIGDLGGYPSGVFTALIKIIPCDTLCYTELALPNSIKTWLMEPTGVFPSSSLRDAFMRNYLEHPVFLHYTETGDTNTLKMSDFLSQRQFHRLALYNEYYRPSGVEYQLVTTFMLNPESMVSLTLDRHRRDFTEDERCKLDLLRPHLVQAYKNMRTLEIMKKAVEAGGKKCVMVNRSEKFFQVDDEAIRLVSKYFNVSSSQNSLPGMLAGWINSQIARINDESSAPLSPLPLVVNRNGQKLVINFLWGGTTSDEDMLILEERPVIPVVALSIDSDLSEREYEILNWVSRGKTNNEVGLALSISPLTVKKHLENICRKLNVHNRSAAIARLYHR